jgi:hypothetical protein|tara:strand:- start:236 stop:448 length:213 start_codon:yes stop_codon:yes gene_type:complete
MKKFTIEVSHASTAQLSTIGLELKIMSNGWAKHGPRILIDNKKLQAPSLRIPGTGRKRQAASDKLQATSA